MGASYMPARSDVQGDAAWRQPSALPSLPENAIHIWRLRSEARLPAAHYLPWLQPEELARAHRLLRPEDQRDAIASRATLRLLLAHYAAIDARTLVLTRGEHGKPSLPSSELHFNLSHTGNLAVFAFARHIELGIDVEHVRATGDLDDVAAQNFAPAERDALRAMPPEDRVVAFYRCWTRKEALLKAEGSGLFRALDTFAVSVLPGTSTEILSGSPEGWEIAHLDVLPDAPGALAWRLREPAPVLTMLDLSPTLLSQKTA